MKLSAKEDHMMMGCLNDSVEKNDWATEGYSLDNDFSQIFDSIITTVEKMQPRRITDSIKRY